MTEIQAIILAIVQGITELFPISSLGHAVLLPTLLGWRIDQAAPDFLPFLVVMHLGTAVALLLYFRKDWIVFARAILFEHGNVGSDGRRLFVRLVVATIPAVILGGLLEHKLREGFAAPALVAVVLVLNGLMLIAADRFKTVGQQTLARLSIGQSLVIGLCQCLALVPGFSRSGATMAGGYWAGLKHEDAAHFSFLTATPIILGATVLEGPKLLHSDVRMGGLSLLAGAVAGIVAYASIVVLMRWFKTHEANAFVPFGIYCIVAGIASTALLLIH